MNYADITLNKKDKTSLYYQLYKQIAAEIRTGSIASGEKLPGKRTASALLGVSINTVNEAYQMLAAEGYVTALPRSGFVVARLEGNVPPPLQSAVPPVQPQAGPPVQISFYTGDIDTSLFPKATYTRIYREVLASDATLLTRGEGAGDLALRQAIAGYLQAYRGVKCGPEQVVVGAGLEVLVGMLARLFAGQSIAIENPGYVKNLQILQNVGTAVTAANVDEMGINPQSLQSSGAMLAYCTPSHQFPTGAVMPVGRRTQLLQWAAQGGHYIIEDDYDGEFRFDGRPLPCLQGLDEGRHVIYAGTFSRSLAPGIRAAYLVLPGPLVRRWQQMYKGYACTVSRPEQNTLARFIQEGHFARSLNRMRNTYRARRNLLIQALQAQLAPGSYQLHNTHTGLYFLLHLPGLAAGDIAQTARRQGVGIQALASYILPIGSLPPGAAHYARQTLVVGYGGLANHQIQTAAQTLAQFVG